MARAPEPATPRHHQTPPPPIPDITPAAEIDPFAFQARVPGGNPLKPNRHILRPVEEYTEYEEELKLHVPMNEWPQDFALQWVTHSVWGRPELQHRARYERAGWVSIMVGEFDGAYDRFMPDGAVGEIIQDGLVLMARPMSWSMKAKMNNINRGRDRVRIKEQQLRMGDLNGVTLGPDHPTAVRSNIVERSIDTVAMPVPQK